MRILVTGSNGMLGSDLCVNLSEEHDIVGMDILPIPASGGSACTFFQTDITNEEKVREVVFDNIVDLIIHTAAWTDVDGCEYNTEKAYEVNVKGTRSLVLAAKERSIPVVAISTDYVFDGKKGTSYVETDKPDPLGIYGLTKLESEKMVAKELERYAIVRTSGLYGANGGNFVDTIREKAKNVNELNVINDQVGAPTYTKDLSWALGKLISFPDALDKCVFHITNSGECSWYEFAVEILKYSGLTDVTVNAITSEDLGRAAKRPALSVLDNGNFEELTGEKMRPWHEALAEYLGYEV